MNVKCVVFFAKNLKWNCTCFCPLNASVNTFLRSWSWRPSHCKQRETTRASVSQIPFTTPSLMIQWKLGCRCRKQKRKNQPIARPRVEHCHWFILLLVLATPAMQFSLDLKRQSHKQKQCSASNSTGLIFTWSNHSTLLSTTPTITPLLVNTSLKRYQPYIPCYLLWYFISSISYKIPYKLLLWTFWG